jgi:hypothetical protein
VYYLYWCVCDQCTQRKGALAYLQKSWLFTTGQYEAMATLPGPTERPVTTQLDDFDAVPLFMRDLPEHDDGQNVALEALRSLVYEDSPKGGCRILRLSFELICLH